MEEKWSKKDALLEKGRQDIKELEPQIGLEIRTRLYHIIEKRELGQYIRDIRVSCFVFDWIRLLMVNIFIIVRDEYQAKIIEELDERSLSLLMKESIEKYAKERMQGLLKPYALIMTIEGPRVEEPITSFNKLTEFIRKITRERFLEIVLANKKS